MSVDTEIQGKPAHVESAAQWLKNKLAAKLDDAVDKLNDSRKDADGSWHADAGDEFVDLMSKARDKTEDPGQPPVQPPATFSGTPEQVEQYEKDVAAYNAHMDKAIAYSDAKAEAARIDRQYATACEALQHKYSPNQHAAWILNVTDILGEAAVGAIGVNVAMKQSKLHAQAQSLVDETKQAIRDLQAHPERYMKRKWLFFKTLDETKLRADQLALEGKLNQAEKLLDDASKLDGGKIPKVLGRAGKVLGPLGLGLGIYNDYQEGETGTQIVVSQGASAAVGVVAGAGASIAAGAATGALIGSVVPGAGTAVGAVIGTAVGAGAAIFSDGAIESLFENGPDVGKALDEGGKALGDTADAIGSGVSGAAKAVGGWFD